MNIGTPRIVNYAARPYVALRRRVRMPIGPAAGQAMDWVVDEARAQGIEGLGHAIFRYTVVNMPELEMEFGFETQSTQIVSGKLMSGIVPAGRYAELEYEGPYRHLTKVNGMLIDWSRLNGLQFDARRDHDGEHFASRVEFYPNSRHDQPDPDKLQTIVAIKLAD